MNDQQLRERLVRLGAEKPELRKYIRPLLQKHAHAPALTNQFAQMVEELVREDQEGYGGGGVARLFQFAVQDLKEAVAKGAGLSGPQHLQGKEFGLMSALVQEMFRNLRIPTVGSDKPLEDFVR